MAIVSTIQMTAEQFLALGEDPVGVRLELVDGEVAVSPSPVPNHSYVVWQISFLLAEHNKKHKLGEFYQDVDTILGRFTVRRPDVLFFFNDRIHLVGAKAMEGPPDLAIEVISPSSVEVDRLDKFAEYQNAGVANYWVIDPMQRIIDAWHLDAGQYAPAGRGQGNAIVRLQPFPNLEIPLGELWRKM
jgi:Uma2 family endonuclease